MSFKAEAFSFPILILSKIFVITGTRKNPSTTTYSLVYYLHVPYRHYCPSRTIKGDICVSRNVNNKSDRVQWGNKQSSLQILTWGVAGLLGGRADEASLKQRTAISGFKREQARRAILRIQKMFRNNPELWRYELMAHTKWQSADPEDSNCKQIMILIIHPGSSNLRIGRAGDTNPVTITHALAIKRRNGGKVHR